jgi:hypothetical protein
MRPNGIANRHRSFGSRAEMLTSSRGGLLFLRQPNSYCIREKVRSRALKGHRSGENPAPRRRRIRLAFARSTREVDEDLVKAVAPMPFDELTRSAHLDHSAEAHDNHKIAQPLHFNHIVRR